MWLWWRGARPATDNFSRCLHSTAGAARKPGGQVVDDEGWRPDQGPGVPGYRPGPAVRVLPWCCWTWAWVEFVVFRLRVLLKAPRTSLKYKPPSKHFKASLCGLDDIPWMLSKSVQVVLGLPTGSKIHVYDYNVLIFFVPGSGALATSFLRLLPCANVCFCPVSSSSPQPG